MNTRTDPADEVTDTSPVSISRARGTVISYESHEISLADLFVQYWRLKWLHIAILLSAIGAGYALIQYLPVKYRASAVLQYNSEDGQGAQGLLGQTGLGALLGTRQSSELTQLLGRLKTRSFLKPVIELYDLAPVVFPQFWDAERQAWKPEAGGGFTADDAYGALAGAITAKENDETGFIDFSISSLDPKAALTLSQLIPPELNKLYRTEKLDEYSRMIQFIQQELARTETADHRQLLYSLYSKKLADRIIVNVRPDYPFRLIDQATLPLGPYSPNKRLIYILATVGGITLTLLITLLWPTRH